MTIYKIKPEAAEHQQKTIQRIIVITLVIASLIILGVTGYLLIVDDVEITIVLGSVSLWILVIYVSTRKQFSRQMESAKSAEIELGERGITLRKKHEPEVQIRRNEVTGLVLGDKSITVQTADIFRMIPISEDFTGFEEIRSKLSSWMTTETVSKRHYLRYLIPILLPSIGIIAGVGLVLITRSIWPLTLTVVSLLGRTVFFIWFNRKRVDLTARRKLTKMIGYGVQVIFYGYVLVYLLNEFIG